MKFMVVGEYDATGTNLRAYGYQPGSSWSSSPLFVREGGRYYWYQNDHLGTPQQIIAENGAVVWRAEYDSFGRAEVLLETVENNLRFPGQYFDSESGFYYNWHRYYDPGTGLYVTPDPIGLAGGINLYALCGGDPVNEIDPFGLIDYGDGLSYFEGAEQYFFGSDEFINLPFGSVDPGFGLSEFINPCSYGMGTHPINSPKRIDLFTAKSIFTNAGPGRIFLQLQGTLNIEKGEDGCCKKWSFSGYVCAMPNTFDFDPQPWSHRGVVKESMTRGIHYLPFGNSFDIVFVGSRPISTSGCCN